MSTETVSLNDIKDRNNTHYQYKKNKTDPVTGYEDADGPPTVSVASQDETEVNLTVSDLPAGRANDVAFRLAKDMKALATIVQMVNDGIGGAPKQYVRINAADTQADYLVSKLVDGDGILLTVIDATGVKTLRVDLRAKHSIEIDADQLQLDGDVASPGNNRIYGTTAVGARAWRSLDDGMHGNIGGGTLHQVAIPAGASGFMSGADKSKLDNLPDSLIPSGTRMFFGQNLVTGWTMKADWPNNSMLVYTTGNISRSGTRDPILPHNHQWHHYDSGETFRSRTWESNGVTETNFVASGIEQNGLIVRVEGANEEIAFEDLYTKDIEAPKYALVKAATKN
jgi:hypothetical protein